MSTHPRFRGKVAVITAAANGIGRATALRIARDGATAVVAIDIAPELDSACRDIAAQGAMAEAMVHDVTDEDAVAKAFADIEERYGRIDVLINGVGMGARDRASEFYVSEPTTWRGVIESSLVSAMLCARQVAPGMRNRHYGKIVNVSSTVWLAPPPKMVDFAAAKSGLLGFTRALAIELAPFHVNVNMVSPGVTNTPALRHISPEIKARNIAEIPMQMMAEPEDIGNVIAFMASDDARFITGQNLAVSGGRGLS